MSSTGTGSPGTNYTPYLSVDGSKSTNVGEAFSSIAININGRALASSGSLSVYFGGTQLAISSYNDTNIYCAPFTLPGKGTYTISVRGAYNTATYEFHVVTPLATFFPCGSASVICSDQCVTPGSSPAQLRGRVLAISSDEYDDYNNTNYWQHNGSDDGRFGSTQEREAVQWQSSIENQYWYDISGATQRNYQPGPLTRTTYFRRVSTHIEGRFGNRAYWYTSNVVTVSAQGKVPVPATSTYQFAPCGNTTQSLQVAVKKDPTIKSLNWWVPYAGWTVNGYSTFNNNSSYRIADNPNSINNQVTIEMPVGTAPGNYTISVSSNGDCGLQSADATITITVGGQNLSAASNVDIFMSSSSSQCYWVYDVTCNLIPGATRYWIVDDYGTRVDGQVNANFGWVYFPINIYGGHYATVTIYADNSCASSQTTVSKYIEQADPYCGDNNFRTEIYPNPSAQEVTFNHKGGGEISFYDKYGALRKSIQLDREKTKIMINTLDLPNGIYHVRVVSNGKIQFQKQLVVQH